MVNHNHNPQTGDKVWITVDIDLLGWATPA